MRSLIAALLLCVGCGVGPAAAAWCPDTRPECVDEMRQLERQVRHHRLARHRLTDRQVDRQVDRRLVASWHEFDTRTASGERFDPEARACAHPSAPFGTWLRVTAIASGRSTECRVNDRGPFKRGRSIDLTRAGARDLGILAIGTAAVTIERIPAPAAAAAIAAIPLPPARPAVAPAADLAAIAANEAHDDGLSRARAYLVLTSTPGGTMSLLGADWAIGQLHPTFVTRAAAAIAEARASGLPRAGIYSSYRPPGLGVGGFRDKFNSLHAYGLAADFTGIGSAGSADAVKWFRIATRRGLYNPYGPHNRAEFNHYQATRITIVLQGSALRRTVTRQGPVDTARMWKVAAALIDAGQDRHHVRRRAGVRLAQLGRHRHAADRRRDRLAGHMAAW